MRTIRIISVLALMFFASASCFGDIGVESVSKERAKELGVTITTRMVATNEVGVWLEFAPKGELQTFSSAKLEITSGERRLVAATLAPEKQTKDSVVVYFSTDKEHLATSTLLIFYRLSGGFPPYSAFSFNVGDFVSLDLAQ